MKRRFFVATVVVSLVVIGVTAPMLPERVAIHFGFSGAADGWASRSAATVIAVVITLALGGLFLGLGHWTRSMPLSMINLPLTSKQRWIDAGKENLLREGMARDLYTVGGMTMLLLIGVQVVTVLANRRTPAAELGSAAIVLVAVFLVGTTIWAVSMHRKYQEPPG